MWAWYIGCAAAFQAAEEGSSPSSAEEGSSPSVHSIDFSRWPLRTFSLFQEKDPVRAGSSSILHLTLLRPA